MRPSNLPIATMLAIACTTLAGCASDQAHTASDPNSHDHDTQATPAMAAVGRDDATPVTGRSVTLWVYGMSCPKCVSNVDVTLSRIPGVTDVTINMRDGIVVAALDGVTHPTRGAFARAVDDAGLTLVRLEAAP
ncbi:MAG: heavy-metal-associated domain-containing protein [Phycisphaerae bacterium]|nr:heavy-metal-associated domain-containing protein [Phycisphaerae bacterium]